MTEDEWQPLPPGERKKAEELLHKDKILMDRAFRKGQLSREYCVSKTNELKIKYGLAPPVWTEEEAQEFDTELDAALEEMEAAVEEHEWKELSPEERERAEKKLLREKKRLNKAFKLGKISREKCAAKVRVVEVELGLVPPPTEASEQEFQEFLESEAVASGPDDPLFEDLDEEDWEEDEEVQEPEERPLGDEFEGPEERPLDNEIEDPEERPPDDEFEDPEERPLDNEIEDPEERPSDDDEIEEPEKEWDPGTVGGDTENEEGPETLEELSLHDEVDELESLSLDDDELENLSLDDDTTPDEPVWTPLSAKKRKEAEKELQKFNRDLAKAFNKGELTSDECAARRKGKEVELGLAPISEPEPIEEFSLSEEKEPEPEEPLVEEASEDIAEEEELELEEPLAEQASEDIAEEGEPEPEEPLEEGPLAADEPELKYTDQREKVKADLMTIPGVGEYKAGILYDAGFRNLFDIHEAGFEELSGIKHIGPKTAEAIIESLEDMLSQILHQDVIDEVEEPATEEIVDEKEQTEEMLGIEDELVSSEMKVGKGLLIVGIVLCLMGVFGVVGLRLGYIQNLLGDPIPYPGVGYVEPSGHIVSIIPFVIGLVTIVYWGIKNDPIYYERERLIQEKDELDEEMVIHGEFRETVEHEEFEETVEHEEFEETVEPDGSDELPVEDADPELADSMDDLDIALQEEEKRMEYCEKMLEAAYIMPADRERLNALLHTNIGTDDFIDEIKTAVARKKESETEEDEELERELSAKLGDVEKADEEESSEEDILKEIEDL